MMIEKNSPTHKEVRVLLAHSTRLMREAMADMLREAGFEIAADVENESELVRVTRQYNPDILLLDWALPKVPLDMVRQLAGEKKFKWAVVLVGQPKAPEDIVEAMQAGAQGFLSLDLPLEEFVSRLPLLAQGDFVVSRGVNTALSLQWGARTLSEATDGLSDREREVLALVSTGATNEEIAQELFITKNTVKIHLRHIMDKLDLRNRQQLVVYAVREGLVEESGNGNAKERQPQFV
jgi:DNA-binding NarL/FixJ family response regulator